MGKRQIDKVAKKQTRSRFLLAPEAVFPAPSGRAEAGSRGQPSISVGLAASTLFCHLKKCAAAYEPDASGRPPRTFDLFMKTTSLTRRLVCCRFTCGDID